MSTKSLRRSVRGRCAAGLLVLGGLCAPAALLGQEAPPAEGRVTAETSSANPVAAHGLTVSWNKGAGRFEAPSPERMAKISEAFARMFAAPEGQEKKLEVRTLANGMKMAKLPLSLLSASVVRVDDSGRPSGQVCVDGARVGSALQSDASDAEVLQ